MTRTKVKIEYITNDGNRRSSFNKRKKCLIKKVDELTILCGVEACAIVFGQDDHEPEVWTSPLGVQRVVSKFRLMSDFQQAINMENQESFTRERISKAQEKLRKLKQENREKEMTHMVFKIMAGEELSDMDLADLNEIRSLIDTRSNKGYRFENRDTQERKRKPCSRAMTMANGMRSSATSFIYH